MSHIQASREPTDHGDQRHRHVMTVLPIHCKSLMGGPRQWHMKPSTLSLAVVDFCKQNNGGCAKVAKCSQKGTQVSCSCQKGYKGDGHSCTEIDPCANGVNGGCHEHATCRMTGPVSATSLGTFSIAALCTMLGLVSSATWPLLPLWPLLHHLSHLSVFLVKVSVFSAEKDITSDLVKFT
jgi:hypothetical protein